MIYLELDDALAIACEVLKLDAITLMSATDLGLADSAVARPRSRFGGDEFYPTVEDKKESHMIFTHIPHPSYLGHAFSLQSPFSGRTPSDAVTHHLCV